MNQHATFDPGEAFARNIGWITPAEAEALTGKRVAIAGMGGVGGSHLLTLVRLGVGAFTLADPDVFELANFNRQAGADLMSLGRNKAEVMAERARRINPGLRLRVMPEAVGADNVDAFLADADLYLDALDFFAFEARERVFARCAELGIPAVTAAPLGMGTALLCFLPGGMTFEAYFGLAGRGEEEKILRFLVGLAPAMLQRGYVAWPQAVDLAAHRGPSTPMAVELCAGVAATEVLKILLGRGPVRGAPRGLQFDAYRRRMVRTWRPGGHRNPLTRLTLAVARRRLARLRAEAAAAEAPTPATPAGRVLELARWAPSGDNTQPWRFRIKDDARFTIFGHDTRDHCVYDLDGHASHLAHGALVETVAIAATTVGRRAVVRMREAGDPPRPVFEVRLEPAEAAPDPLAPFIRLRTTQRRAMGRRRLAPREREALRAAVAPDYELILLDAPAQRRRAAWLAFRAARLRLTIPEAWAVHREVIAWGARHSEDRIPEAAVGFDPLTARLSRWALRSWPRVAFLNRWLAGTLAPRIQLDLLPGLRCAGFVALAAPRPPEGTADWVEAGRRVQRLWLAATRLGLQMQPQMTPLIFARYAREGVKFSDTPGAADEAAAIDRRLRRLLGEAAPRTVWLARIGPARPVPGRSLRLPLARLCLDGAAG
ncbi:molybdopterin/thiamine biosynthesis adenylyltransferase [Inmirania thermothiophila]|uniref:Molybdopterin/thiamine biosynthesis adenylyltransferase n=1 Tax=Inmirania thermothiophila TaxID=1750597 RepID=A0A3N1Y7J0_9GAMM|nr:molybdopterin/thiamine biosynthesis adenylyltransferase [Inmirania thermothiophila]